jgi:hypothetical protein
MFITLSPSVSVLASGSGSGASGVSGESRGVPVTFDGCLGSSGDQVQMPIHSWSGLGISSSELVIKASRFSFHLMRNQELLINLRARSPCEAVWMQYADSFNCSPLVQKASPRRCSGRLSVWWFSKETRVSPGGSSRET